MYSHLQWMVCLEIQYLYFPLTACVCNHSGYYWEINLWFLHCPHVSYVYLATWFSLSNLHVSCLPATVLRDLRIEKVEMVSTRCFWSVTSKSTINPDRMQDLIQPPQICHHRYPWLKIQQSCHPVSAWPLCANDHCRESRSLCSWLTCMHASKPTY